MKTRIIVLAMTAGLAAVSSALAQPGTGGTISDGNAVFTLGDSPTTPGSNGPGTFFSVNGPGGANHLFSGWWWLRVEGSDTRENAVNSAVSSELSPAGTPNRLRLTYNYGTYRVTMEWTVSGLADGFGFLTQTLTVLNLSGQTQTFNVYNYNDIDVQGSASNDTAIQTGANTIRFTDGQFPFIRATYQASQANQVGVQPAIRNILTDANVDSLAGGVGANSGPADLEVGSQFTFRLDSGVAQTVSTTLTIIPTPGAAALLGLGGLLAARRRRA